MNKKAKKKYRLIIIEVVPILPPASLGIDGGVHHLVPILSSENLTNHFDDGEVMMMVVFAGALA